MRTVAVYLLLVAALAAARLTAGEVAVPTVTCDRIPVHDDEVAKAHAASEHASLEVPAGYPLAQPQFDQRIGYRTSAGDVVWCDVARRNVAALGMEMTAEDQQDLPLLTGQAILDRLQGQYMALQVRVQREGESGAPFLHYRPMAAACAYGNTQRTVGLANLMQTAVRDVRSLGLFVPKGEPLLPESLRTLVVVYRTNQEVQDSESTARRTVVRYELVLVRARDMPKSAGQSSDVTLHVFGTTDGRRTLHYLMPYTVPGRPRECDVQSTIYFTDYALGNLFPTARAARKVAVRSTASYSLDDLHAFAASHNLGSTAWDRIDLVLDAIIDQRISARGEAPAATVAEETSPSPTSARAGTTGLPVP